MDDNVTQYGITKDLEAMKEIGLKGAQIFYIGGNAGIGRGTVDVVTRLAGCGGALPRKECDRLGTSIGFNQCGGCFGVWLAHGSARSCLCRSWHGAM